MIIDLVKYLTVASILVILGIWGIFLNRKKGLLLILLFWSPWKNFCLYVLKSKLQYLGSNIHASLFQSCESKKTVTVHKQSWIHSYLHRRFTFIVDCRISFVAVLYFIIIKIQSKYFTILKLIPNILLRHSTRKSSRSF